MRRLAGAVLAALLVAPVGAGAAPATSRRALEASARASVLAATLDVQPSFDPAIAESRSTSSNVGTTSLDGVIWPGFLVDAFFFLYGFQSVERLGLGISEARWPQGPTDADATLSGVALASVTDPAAAPAKVGESSASARPTGASGRSSIAAVSLPGGVAIAAASSSSHVRTAGGVASGEALQEVAGVTAGPLEIETIRADASAAAGQRRAAESSLLVVGARVAGQAVSVDDEGVRAATDAAQEIVDAALGASGIAVRLVPAARKVSGDDAEASSGGVLVSVRAAQEDPTGTPRNVEVGYLLGAASVSARAVPLDAPPAPPRPGAEALGTTFSRARPAAAEDAPPAAPPTLIRRRVIATSAAPGSDARGAYGAVVLAALALLLARPLIRFASRP